MWAFHNDLIAVLNARPGSDIISQPGLDSPTRDRRQKRRRPIGFADKGGVQIVGRNVAQHAEHKRQIGIRFGSDPYALPRRTLSPSIRDSPAV